MKIRSGFVSNSSSSSFTCNVCKTTNSGMDMSLSEADMFECINGHTCCNSHKTAEFAEPSKEGKQAYLIARLDKGYRASIYINRPEEKIREINNILSFDDAQLNSVYEDAVADSGVSESDCPICQFQVLDENDAFRFLLKKYSLNKECILAEIKSTFPNYTEFSKYIA